MDRYVNCISAVKSIERRSVGDLRPFTAGIHKTLNDDYLNFNSKNKYDISDDWGFFFFFSRG